MKAKSKAVSPHETKPEVKKADDMEPRDDRNVKVFCRFRPCNEMELKNGGNRMIVVNGNVVNLPQEVKDNRYYYDKVFEEKSTQEQVYQAVGKPLLDEILQGYNATIFAYGQSGCLSPETLILLIDGSVIQARDVQVGDKLVDEKGNAREVIKLFTGISHMFKIRDVKKKSFYTVNLDHILTVQFESKLIDLSVKDLLKQKNKHDYLGVRMVEKDEKKLGPVLKELETYPFEIEDVGMGLYSGFQLEPIKNRPERFLLSDGTITHNSGKTTTMTGYASSVDNPDALSQEGELWKTDTEMGVVPRLIKDLFIAIRGKKGYEFLVSMSYVEIYLEKIRDLLSPLRDDLKIREDRFRGLWIEDVTETYVNCFEDAVRVMRKGELNRTVAETAMNAHSSRSHSVLVMHLQQNELKTGKKIISRIVFVDLAGSEKVAKTKAEGLLLKQASSTNKSLLTLGLVIRSLAEKKSFIPYRDSKLTRLLTDSLGGNSKTHLVITCSPAKFNYEETLSTLRFGAITQTILNKPVVNLEMNVEEYKRLLFEANEKLATQQIIISALTKDLNKLIELCEKKGIDVKDFKKEYNLIVQPTLTPANYEESLDQFQKMAEELDSKTALVTELQKSISLVKNEIENIRSVANHAQDDLRHCQDDLNQKIVEIESLRANQATYLDKIAQLEGQLGKVDLLLKEKNETAEQAIKFANVRTQTLEEENIGLRGKVANLCDENNTLRENMSKTWKPTEEDTKTKEELLQLHEKYAKLSIVEEELKSQLEGKKQHVKTLEDGLKNNQLKLQETTSDFKRRQLDYEKKIKDLESQLRILKMAAIKEPVIVTPIQNEF